MSGLRREKPMPETYCEPVKIIRIPESEPDEFGTMPKCTGCNWENVLFRFSSWPVEDGNCAECIVDMLVDSGALILFPGDDGE
jgi:hypothetical protein